MKDMNFSMQLSLNQEVATRAYSFDLRCSYFSFFVLTRMFKKNITIHIQKGDIR